MEGDLLTFAIVAAPAHGTLTGDAPNLTYTPALNYNGADSFTFTANDGTAESVTAAVSITVTPVNDLPVAAADSYTLTQDTALTVASPGVLANDTDVEGSTLTATRVTAPAHGTVTLNGNGGFVYTPATGYTGVDSFTYQAGDGVATSGVCDGLPHREGAESRADGDAAGGGDG